MFINIPRGSLNESLGARTGLHVPLLNENLSYTCVLPEFLCSQHICLSNVTLIVCRFLNAKAS